MSDVNVITLDVADTVKRFKEANMAEKTFTWCGESTWTRSFGAKAPSALEKGKTYPIEGFPAEVVAEWVKTGHAKYAGKDKPAKEESNG